MKTVFMMAGSLRKDSFNKRLLNVVAQYINDKKLAHCDVATLNEYECSLYNGDDEASNGIPSKITSVAERIQNKEYLIFALPEYNGFMPGVFKNFFDWVSRVRLMPWGGKKVLLISASLSGFGGMRGFIHNRMPFESCGAVVYPKSFFLSNAYSGFDDKGNLKDGDQQKNLNDLLVGFFKF